MKVTRPLSASSTQTYVGARYMRHGDAISELPTARYVTGMLNEHGIQNAKPVVTPAVNRNDDDESEEASAEEHRSLRRIVGKSQLAPRRPDIAFATNPLARSLAGPSKSDIIASKRLLRYLGGTQDLGLKLQVQNRACSTVTVFTAIGLEIDPPRKSVSSWVIMMDGFLISAGPAITFESARCLVLRTWLTLTRNLQTNVRSSSADQRWASQRSRNSSVVQFCNKFITIFLSLCHRS